MSLRPLHWAGRLLSSVRPGPPRRRDLAWAHEQLTAPERRLFDRMSNPDRRHAIGVARRVDAALPPNLPDRSVVLRAALLHDVGKVASGLRTYGRVIATLSGAVGGRSYAEVWQDTRGFTRRVGLYLRYPELGAEMLAVADSDPRVIAWAREHHLDEESWTIPVDWGRVLAAADR